MSWQDRFDRLLKAMASGEPHKAEKQAKPSPEQEKRDRRPSQ